MSRPSHSICPSLPLSTILCHDHRIPSIPLFHYLRTCVGTITFHLSLSSTIYELVSGPSHSIYPSLPLYTNLCPDHRLLSFPLLYYLQTCVPIIIFHLSLSSTIYELVSRPSHSIYPSLPLSTNLCPDHHIPPIPLFHYLGTCVPTIIFHLSLSSIIYELVSRPSYSIYPSLPLSTNLCPDHHIPSIPLFHYLLTCVPTVRFPHISLVFAISISPSTHPLIYLLRLPSFNVHIYFTVFYPP